MEEILLISALTIVASWVGTLSGFGSSTVLVPVLLLFFPLPETLLLAGILHWFNDIWKLTLFRKGIKWNLILSFGIPGVIATFIGASLILTAPEELLSRILGGFLITYAFYLLIHHKFKVPTSTPTAIAGGTLSGFFAGIFGLGGAIRSAFLTTYNLPKVVYIATAGAIGLAIDSTRVVTYLAEGSQLRSTLWFGLILFIPASFIGAKIAQKMVKKIPQKQFRFVIAMFLLVAGVKFLFLP
ncbi:MAG: sulfite exporter TauE/SafE family protein [Patescibacteria group bacterium]